MFQIKNIDHAMHLAIISASAPRCARNVQSNYHSVGMSNYIIYIYNFTYIICGIIKDCKHSKPMGWLSFKWSTTLDCSCSVFDIRRQFIHSPLKCSSQKLEKKGTVLNRTFLRPLQNDLPRNCRITWRRVTPGFSDCLTF